jgi:hypothetical protein
VKAAFWWDIGLTRAAFTRLDASRASVFRPNFAPGQKTTSHTFPEREVEKRSSRYPRQNSAGAIPFGHYLEGMSNYDWHERFKQVYDAGLARYHKGERNPPRLFGKNELEFLASIGCSAQELFDFIDDGVRYSEPSFETTLLTSAVRRDYFLLVQNGVPSANVISMDDLPSKKDEVDGIAWLPRLIVKARVKLRGEMPPDLMYGCGGDRPFLRSMNVELAEFLRLVWLCGDDDRKIIDYVKRRRAAGARA